MKVLMEKLREKKLKLQITILILLSEKNVTIENMILKNKKQKYNPQKQKENYDLQKQKQKYNSEIRKEKILSKKSKTKVWSRKAK